MLKRTNLLLLALAMLLAVITTFAVLRQLSAWRQQHLGEAQVEVVVVAKSVPPHTVIDSTDVALRSVPRSAVISGAVTSLAEVVGKYSASQWYPGQQVLAQMVLNNAEPAAFPLSIPPGYRAFTIANDPVSGVDHFISPGDHVDVLVTYSDKEDNGPIAKLVLQDVLVLYADNSPAPQSTQATVSGANASGTGSNGASKAVDTLTLAVRPEDMLALDYARTFGQLHVVLRNPNDSQTLSLPDVRPGGTAGH